MKELQYLWSLPYLRFDILFIFLPTGIFWAFFRKYLWQFRKTLLKVIILSLCLGIPMDLLATNILHVWFFNPVKNIGFQYLGLPLEEWVFVFVIPQMIAVIFLLMKKYST